MHFESHAPYLPPRNPPILAHLYLLVVAVHNQKTAHRHSKNNSGCEKRSWTIVSLVGFNPFEKLERAQSRAICSWYSCENCHVFFICSSLSTNQEILGIKAHCDLLPTSTLTLPPSCVWLSAYQNQQQCPGNQHHEIKKPWGMGLSWSMTSIYSTVCAALCIPEHSKCIRLHAFSS